MYQNLDVRSEGTTCYSCIKIRIAMGHIDEKAQRGRGSIRKAPILAMASYSNIPRHKQKKRRPKTYPKFFKMVFSEELTKESINDVAFEYIKLRSRVKTDGYRVYNDLKELMRKHIQKVIPQQMAHIELPGLHTAIGNFNPKSTLEIYCSANPL
ncbi:MAG: hypothetical protein SGI87_04660 [Flavobacteriales bacterium]|nr:hypothetical protein [Flavobacteriales bacterium]